MATYEPTRFFEIDKSHGSIVQGKVADLVILDASPVNDIRNTFQINAVIRSGRLKKNH